MNVPNFLTVIRFFLIPYCGYHLYLGNFTLAGIIFIAAAITDVLDGYIARKYNMVTKFGKLADPAADKLLLLTALFLLAIKNSVSLIFPILVFLKELMIGIGGLVLLKHNYVVASNKFGKFAAFVFNGCVAFIIIFTPTQWVGNLLILISVILMFISLVIYTLRYFRIKEQVTSADRQKT